MEPVILRVTEFGAKPDSGEDATAAVQRAIDAAIHMDSPAVIEFPQGRYDFYPEQAVKKPFYISNTASEEEAADITKTIGLFFRKAKGITVDGNGSLLLFHGKMTMFVFDECEDVVVRNVSIDYARPTIAEMTVERIDGGMLDVTVHPDSRYAIEDGKLFWVGDGWRFRTGPAQQFDPLDGTTWRTANPIEEAVRVEELSSGKLRLHSSRTLDTRVGRVYQMRDGIRDEAGIFIHKSVNVTWQDAGIHYMHGLGLVGQFSENLTFRRLDMSPRPETGRTAAAFCDFMHFSGCRGEITVEDSRFAGAHDDAMNVHGTHLRIVGQPAPNQVRVRFMHGQTYGFDAFHTGDSIDFVSGNTLTVIASNKVKAVERLTPRELLLTLEHPAPERIEANDVIENVTWTPTVCIRRNHFSRVPTRGILVTTRRSVVIEDNVFERMEMSGILISDDANFWYESGMVRDVTIRRNRFIACGRYGHPVIWIEPENRSVSREHPVHSNIRIEENEFRSIGCSIVSAKCARKLELIGNRIESSADMKQSQPVISLLACSEVKIHGNVLEGEGLVCEVLIKEMSLEDVDMMPSEGLSIRT